ISGGSIVPWAELLHRSPHPSDDEVNLGSLPDLQVDAISDNDIIKHLEREASLAGGSSRNLLTGDSAKRLAELLPPSESKSLPAASLTARTEFDLGNWQQTPDDGGSSVD